MSAWSRHTASIIAIAAMVGSAGPVQGAIRLSPDVIYRADVFVRLPDAALFQDEILPAGSQVASGASTAQPGDANDLYQRGLTRQKAGDLGGARRDLEAAVALAPDNAAIRASLGYVCEAAGDLKAARTNFAAALERDPGLLTLYDELGYLNLRLGDTTAADKWFREAIDRHRAESAATSAQVAERDERLYRLRREVAQLEDDLDLSLYSIFRRGSGAGAPNPTGRSLTQSQGGLEAAYRLPITGLGAGRTVQAFARLLWSYKPDSLAIRSNSYQSGIGFRVKPLARQNLVLSMERLVSLGKAARDDWLARAGYSWSLGYGFDPFRMSWPYVLVYGDAALAFPTGPDLFLTGEVRAGQSWRLGSRISITPHAVLEGSRQEDGPVTTTLVEAGPGISLKCYFDDSAYRAYRANAELLLQYRAKIAGNSTGTSGFAATFVFNY